MDRTPTVPFQSGSPVMVIGPMNCDKTYWINQLLENDMFTQPVVSILYCYGVYQDFYNQMLFKKVQMLEQFYSILIFMYYLQIREIKCKSAY